MPKTAREETSLVAQTACLWSIWESVVNCVSLATGVNQRKRGGRRGTYCMLLCLHTNKAPFDCKGGREGGREGGENPKGKGGGGEREGYTWRVRRRGKGRKRERARERAKKKTTKNWLSRVFMLS